jgi:hypothetical protein
MKNPSFNTQLNVVLMSLNNIQLTQVNTFSSNSVSNPGVQTASTLIQKDLFELASKALLELQESKNSSSLVVEVNFQFFMFYCFSCFLVLFLLSYKTNIIEHCSIPKKV